MSKKEISSFRKLGNVSVIFLGILAFLYSCTPGHKTNNTSASIVDSIKNEDSTQKEKKTSLVLNERSDSMKVDTLRKDYLLPFIQRHLTMFPYQEKSRKGWCGLYKFSSPKLLYTSQLNDSVKNIALKIYNAGKITSGTYKGASYYILRLDVTETGKNEQLLLRFLKTNDSTLVLLPHLSSPNVWYRILTQQRLVIPDNKLLKKSPFTGIKETYADNSVNISNFASPKNILNGTYVLNRFLYVPETKPVSYLKKVKNNIYTSENPVKNLRQLISILEYPVNYTTDSASFQEYLQMNAYYLLYNDGMIGVYTPVWNNFQITLAGKSSNASKEYNLYGKLNASGHPASFAMVIDSATFFTGHHLSKTGNTSWGDLFFIKEINSSFLDKLYSFYLKTYKWHFRKSPYNEHKYTFEEFLQEYPILFWKDEFGRWYCGTKKKFLPPHYNRQVLN